MVGTYGAYDTMVSEMNEQIRAQPIKGLMTN